MEALNRAHRAEARLRDALGAMSDGFALYDAEDRLMVCNSSFVKLYPELKESAVVGASYEHIIMAEIECEAASSEAPQDRRQARLVRLICSGCDAPNLGWDAVSLLERCGEHVGLLASHP